MPTAVRIPDNLGGDERAIMPEPTTAANRKAVPSHSANMRSASRGISRLCGRTSDAADFLQFRLQAELVERAQRQCREDRDALMQRPVGILEREATSAGEPLASAGSGTPQCAVIGWPGHTGQASPAALSQTVNTKSSAGDPGLANSPQDFERKPAVS
jgi:hypothetical protein